jgi:hypothetical protein
MGYFLKSNSTAKELLFLMVDSADHLSGKTGLSPTVTIRKPGGAFGTPSGAVTEIANGWYKVAGNATDTNTLGPLLLHATAANADPADDSFNVVAYDPDDAVHLGLSCLPNTAITSNASLLTSGTGTDQLSVTSGRVDLGKALGTAVTLDANNVLNVSTKYLGGTLQTARDVGLSVLLAASQHVIVDSGTVTTLTNLPAIPNNWLTAAGIAAAALNGKGDWSTVNPTNLTAAQIATGVWQDATAGDFTAANSIGKSLYTTGNAPGSTNGLPVVNSQGNVQADVARYAGVLVGTTGGFPQVNVNAMSAGVFTASVLPSGGFNYTHGIDLTSDQGTPALAIRSTSGFDGLFISNTSSGNAVNISNSGSGSALRVTGPFVGAAIVQAIWDALTSALTTVGSIGKKLADAAFGGITGASAVTLTFHDSNGDPVPNVRFTIPGQGSMQSNTSGVAEFTLDDGSYTVLASPTNLVLFPVAALTVSGTTPLTITGASTSLPDPPSASQVTAFVYVRDPHGNLVTTADVVLTFQMATPDSAAVWDETPFTETSDGTGLISSTLQINSKYRARTAEGKWVEFTTGATTPYEIPAILGRID